MKLRNSKIKLEERREGASVLIIVLWIAIGLVSIALYFANAMTFELRASDNRASGMATDQAIEGAARYVSYVLANFATNGAVPPTNLFSCAAVPVGDSHFWLIGRDPSGMPSSEPYFSLVDEGSKLNLNTANTNTLSYLPNMTSDFAEAITDWRSTNSSGAYALTYSQLGYREKNAPFETVDELRLVYGATIDLLAGEDINRNGVLDANEKDLNGNGEVDPGLLEYVTVYTREPNFHSDGTSLTNVNTATQAQLRTLFQNIGVGNASRLATSIYNYTHPRPGQTIMFPGILNFCFFCRNSGMSSDDFAKIYDNVTTSTSAYIRGRVNINTASADVLTALLMGVGVDQSSALDAAQTLITYRQQNPTRLGSVAWLIDALGSSRTTVRALATGRLRHHAQFSVHGGHRRGRPVRTRLSSSEVRFRHQRRRAENHLPPGPQPARLGAGRKGPRNPDRKGNAMNNALKFNFRKRKRLTSVLGLALDGSRLEGVVLRRTNGALQLQQTFSVTLSLDPLTAAPELVGREIRNHLDAAGVRERHCVVGVPLKWTLTAHTELPPLPEADAASLLQLEAERGFPMRRRDVAPGEFALPAGRRQTTRDDGGHSQCTPCGAGTGFGGGEIEAGQLRAGTGGIATAGRGVVQRSAGAGGGRRPGVFANHLRRRRGGFARAGRRARNRRRPAAARSPITFRARRASRWDNCPRSCVMP